MAVLPVVYSDFFGARQAWSPAWQLAHPKCLVAGAGHEIWDWNGHHHRPGMQLQ